MSEAILVTGAGGFLGAHLVAALRSLGHDVRAHTRRDGDLTRATLDYPGVTHVFHLAGKTFVPDSWEHPHAFYEANILGTVTVLEFCRRSRASLTLVSSYVYGPPRELPISEDHPLDAASPYAHSKILAEDAAHFYQNHFQVPVAIVRPFNVYGPGQDERFLIPSLIRQVLSSHCSTIRVRDTRPRRDYLYVADFVDLLLALLDHRGSSVFNAGSGESVSIPELVEVIHSFLPHKKELVSTGEARPDELLDVVAGVGKAWTQLQWKAATPLARGLRQTMDAMAAAPLGS